MEKEKKKKDLSQMLEDSLKQNCNGDTDEIRFTNKNSHLTFCGKTFGCIKQIKKNKKKRLTFGVCS